MLRSYRNPVVPGFYPDPSICRVNDTFYLATSSFNWFPGVPLFKSKDLTSWQPIGHALSRKTQVDLSAAGTETGIFAPSIRYHAGVFYLVTTNVGGSGHFFVTATDPEAEWSDPVPIEGPGFDPDLFFDDDGSVYFVRQDPGLRGIKLARIDLKSGRLLDEGRQIWPGFEDPACEAPHLYKKDGFYYLIVAEGGTWRGHMIVAARSRTIYGPYEGCPANPIFTHRHRSWSPIQSTGHADLVQDAAGHWWALMLGTRPTYLYHLLGRETFLAPVTWRDGWPIINEGRALELEMSADLPPAQPTEQQPERVHFDRDWGPEWNTLQRPLRPEECSRADGGGLRLSANGATLTSTQTPSLVARRQQHHRCRAATSCQLTGNDGASAGLAAFMDGRHHYAFALTRHGSATVAELRRRVGDVSDSFRSEALPTGPVILSIMATPEQYRFVARASDGVERVVGSAETRLISTEVASGFTGAYFALFAEGPGARGDFDWFEYQALTA